jgi:hypothetical protein
MFSRFILFANGNGIFTQKPVVTVEAIPLRASNVTATNEVNQAL